MAGHGYKKAIKSQQNALIIENVPLQRGIVNLQDDVKNKTMDKEKIGIEEVDEIEYSFDPLAEYRNIEVAAINADRKFLC